LAGSTRCGACRMRLSVYEKLQRNMLDLLQRVANGEQVPEQQIAAAREALMVVRSIEKKLATKRASFKRRKKILAQRRAAAPVQTEEQRLELERQTQVRMAEDAVRYQDIADRNAKYMAEQATKQAAELAEAAVKKEATKLYASPSDEERLDGRAPWALFRPDVRR
jgi:hypothetical protein